MNDTLKNQPQPGVGVTRSDGGRAEQVYLYRGGQRIHYQVVGPVNAPPLVLLHGIGGSVNWWQENLPAFGQCYRTYALDLPGFGQSWRLNGPVTIERLADFVQGWLETLGIERTHLLGHSMGGQVAARLTARQPNLVDRLVLAAPSGLWLNLTDRLHWARTMPKVRVPLRQSLTIAVGTMRTDTLALGLSLRAILADRTAADTLAALTRPTSAAVGRSGWRRATVARAAHPGSASKRPGPPRIHRARHPRHDVRPGRQV